MHCYCACAIRARWKLYKSNNNQQSTWLRATMIIILMQAKTFNCNAWVLYLYLSRTTRQVICVHTISSSSWPLQHVVVSLLLSLSVVVLFASSLTATHSYALTKLVSKVTERKKNFNRKTSVFHNHIFISLSTTRPPHDLSKACILTHIFLDWCKVTTPIEFHADI